MTSDDTIADLPAGEWDDDTLALLKYDPPVVTEPETTSELVLLPGYTQSERDHRLVEELRRIGAAAEHLHANEHTKTPELLVREAALIIGAGRLAAKVMSPEGPYSVTPEDTCRCGSNIYAALVAETREARIREREAEERKTFKPEPPAYPPAKPKTAAPRAGRRRPSQARKTITGAGS